MIKLRLVQTCGACPEQYDAYYGDNKVGYLRLRHGHFRAEHYGTVVYEADTEGDGIFREDEREHHLNMACWAIIDAMQNEETRVFKENLFTIEQEETPISPKKPTDPTIEELEESKRFWAEHALSK